MVPVIVLLPFAAVVAAAVIIATSHAQLALSRTALATVTLPKGGGTVGQVVAVGGRERQVVPVRLVGNRVVPVHKLPAGEQLAVQATVKRPGWISWLTGKTEKVKLTETTPVAHVASDFITAQRGQPLTVNFDTPVVLAGYGPLDGAVAAKPLASAQTALTMHEDADAGTASVAAAARTWEIRRSRASPGSRPAPRRPRSPRRRRAPKITPRHEDHAHLLQAGQQGPRQPPAAGLAEQRR